MVCRQPKEGGSGTPTYAQWLLEYAGERRDFGDAEFCHVEEHRTEGLEGVNVRRLSYADWTEKVMIASAAEKAVTPMLEESVRFGIHAHALLAGIRHAADAEVAVERYARQEKLREDERNQYAAVVRDVVSHPDTARFFDPAFEVKNECDLTDGSVPGRPDRVVFTPDETWVVDFKTGADARGEYDRQLQHYCRAISDMGYSKVSGWLVFLRPSVHVRQVVLEEGV